MAIIDRGSVDRGSGMVIGLHGRAIGPEAAGAANSGQASAIGQDGQAIGRDTQAETVASPAETARMARQSPRNRIGKQIGSGNNVHNGDNLGVVNRPNYGGNTYIGGNNYRWRRRRQLGRRQLGPRWRQHQYKYQYQYQQISTTSVVNGGYGGG